jgi:type I restriction enzyme S subunit
VPLVVTYYAYLFKSNGYIRALQSTASFIRDGQDLNFANFCEVDLPCPPLNEQSAIARFLDHSDRRIRRYIRAKLQLVKLLEEQKQATIHRAFTRGLDPGVRLRASGVQWLGNVPGHWQVRTLGQIAAAFRTGPFGSVLHQSDYIEGGIPLVNPIHMRQGRIVEDTRCSVPESVATRLSEYRLRRHDLVFARRGELGRCALVRDREIGWLCGTGSIVVRPIYDSLNPEFLIESLQVGWVGQYVSSLSVGATMTNLNTAILKKLPLVIPPPEEQAEILRQIGTQVSGIRQAISCTERQIELLRELRIRLIADVVTGHLDVREAAARLPENIGEVDEAYDVDTEANVVDESSDEVDAVAAEAEV